MRIDNIRTIGKSASFNQDDEELANASYASQFNNASTLSSQKQNQDKNFFKSAKKLQFNSSVKDENTNDHISPFFSHPHNSFKDLNGF
jgi:hypothetical protein